jgi:hypothetical protein
MAKDTEVTNHCCLTHQAQRRLIRPLKSFFSPEDISPSYNAQIAAEIFG